MPLSVTHASSGMLMRGSGPAVTLNELVFVRSLTQSRGEARNETTALSAWADCAGRSLTVDGMTCRRPLASGFLKLALEEGDCLGC
jgi:hypothetical protein